MDSNLKSYRISDFFSFRTLLVDKHFFDKHFIFVLAQ